MIEQILHLIHFKYFIYQRKSVSDIISLNSFFKNLLFCIFVCMCECAPRVWGPIKRLEEGSGSPGAGVTSHCESPDLALRNDLRSSGKATALVTYGSSLQPLLSILWPNNDFGQVTWWDIKGDTIEMREMWPIQLFGLL